MSHLRVADEFYNFDKLASFGRSVLGRIDGEFSIPSFTYKRSRRITRYTSTSYCRSRKKKREKEEKNIIVDLTDSRFKTLSKNEFLSNNMYVRVCSFSSACNCWLFMRARPDSRLIFKLVGLSSFLCPSYNSVCSIGEIVFHTFPHVQKWNLNLPTRRVEQWAFPADDQKHSCFLAGRALSTRNELL